MPSVSVFKSAGLVALAAISACSLVQLRAAPPVQAPELVQKALSREIAALQDKSRPMRYRLHKSSPRLSTTKDMVETRDGVIGMMVEANESALSAEDTAREQSRLDDLLENPAKQKKRKQTQDEDTARALKALRYLPTAFLYTDRGEVATPAGPAESFTFVPNPKFDPPDLETTVLTGLTGEMIIDLKQTRVVRLEVHLRQDVDFGWGILGRLARGGWLRIDQREVLPGIWRMERFQMDMTGRVLFRSRTFQTTEEETQFARVPEGLTFRQGLALLRSQLSVSR